jgi:hypothetical protein
MNILLKPLFRLSLMMLIISGCNAVSSNSQNATLFSSDKCPDKPTGSLNDKNVEPIKFNSQSITKSGQVRAGEYLAYAFDATSGQRLNRETKEDICIWLYAPDNQMITGKDLPQTGKYIIQVSAPKGSTSFDLRLSLESTSTASISSTSSTTSIPSPDITATPINTTTPSTSFATRTPSVTTNNISRPSPEKLVEDYFAKINNGQFEDAWNLLPVELQKNKQLHPNGYNSFLEWYRDQVDHVDVQDISSGESNDNLAIVYLRSRYQMKSGRKAPINLKFNMAWNESSQRWDIQSIKANN